MADTDKNAEKEVTAPLSIKKLESPAKPSVVLLKKTGVVGEDDQTAKIPRPPKSPGAGKLVVPLAKTDDAEPIKPKANDEEKTAKIPKLSKPGEAGKDDKKVVLNSATDSTIKPSDATTMAPAVVPVGMKPTESGNVAVVDNIAPAVAKVKPSTATPPPVPTTASSSQGRKTIKLKPLKKDASPEEDDNAEETLSMDRKSLLEGENISSLTAGKSNDFEDEATVKIQKPTMKKPAHPAPSAVPGSKATIKLRPSTTPPPVGVAPAGITKTEPFADEEQEETVSISKKTIRLVPKKPGEDDATQKTPKQTAPAAPKPSAPTIKLQETDGVSASI